MKIVAPKHIHKYLLNSLRKDDPFLDISLVSKEELARSIYPSVSEATLLCLIKKKKLNYDIATFYLEYLPYVDSDISSKTHYLLSLKNELQEKGLLVEPLKSEYRNSEVTVIGYYPIDFELIDIFKKLNIKYEFKNNENNLNDIDIHTFEKAEDEVYFVLNEIASLIDKGEDINNINILRRNNEYDYYLKKYCLKFGYQINIKNEDTLISSGGVKLFFNYYDKTHNIEESLASLKEEMKDDPMFPQIEDLVNQSIFEDLDYQNQREYLIHKFKEKKVESVRYDNSVNVIDKYSYLENKTIFIMGFAQGFFPKSFKDDKYFNYEELHQINRLNGKDKTKIDECSIFDFLNSNNTFIYSFSKKGFGTEFYLSPIAKFFKTTLLKTQLADDFYSKEVLSLAYSGLKDLEYYYKERKENFLKVRDVISLSYNTYDNQYIKKAQVYGKDSTINLSTTSLDKYSSCRFKYYLDNVLKVDASETTYSMAVGNIAHHMFEVSRKPGFDFEKEFDEEVNKYELKKSEKYVLTHNIKKQIKTAIDGIKKREEGYTNPRIYNEVKLSHKLKDNTTLFGVVDNLVTLDNKYFVCIDYKTGSTKFDDKKFQFGQSSQLPTYSLLVSEDSRFKNLELIGLYINNVLTSSIYVPEEENEVIPSYLKLNGKTLADINKFTYLDKTISSSKSAFVNGVSMKKEGNLKDSKAIVDKLTFDSYKQTVTRFLLEMDENLRNNNFEIHPIFYSSYDNACQYCKYKDICYVRHYQLRDMAKEENKDE